jgi:hypothetical protein
MPEGAGECRQPASLAIIFCVNVSGVKCNVNFRIQLTKTQFQNLKSCDSMKLTFDST